MKKLSPDSPESVPVYSLEIVLLNHLYRLFLCDLPLGLEVIGAELIDGLADVRLNYQPFVVFDDYHFVPVLPNPPSLSV